MNGCSIHTDTYGIKYGKVFLCQLRITTPSATVATRDLVKLPVYLYSYYYIQLPVVWEQNGKRGYFGLGQSTTNKTSTVTQTTSTTSNTSYMGTFVALIE